MALKKKKPAAKKAAPKKRNGVAASAKKRPTVKRKPAVKKAAPKKRNCAKPNPKRKSKGSVWVETRGTAHGYNVFVVQVAGHAGDELGQEFYRSRDKKQAEWEARALRVKLKKKPAAKKNGLGSTIKKAVTKTIRKVVRKTAAKVTSKPRTRLQAAIKEAKSIPFGSGSYNMIEQTLAPHLTGNKLYTTANKIWLASGPAAQRRRNPVKRKPPVKKRPTRRNPANGTAYEMFTGQDYKGYFEMSVPASAPANLDELGKFHEFKWKDFDGKTHTVDFKQAGANVVLCCDRNRTRLWVAGNAKFPLPAGEHGEITQVTYQQKKLHLGDKEKTLYFHNLGEETGERPIFQIDKDGRMLFKGGAYTIEADGIHN